MQGRGAHGRRRLLVTVSGVCDAAAGRDPILGQQRGKVEMIPCTFRHKRPSVVLLSLFWWAGLFLVFPGCHRQLPPKVVGELATLEHPGGINGLTFSPDGSLLATG